MLPAEPRPGTVRDGDLTAMRKWSLQGKLQSKPGKVKISLAKVPPTIRTP